MPLPESLVEHLFGRLTLRYGEPFLRQYGDLDPNAVKADWADVLDGTSRDSIAYALRYLSSDRPPNAMQFRDQCRRAPRVEPMQLGGPKADPARVHALMAPVLDRLTAARLRDQGMSPAARCVRNIEEIVAKRGYITAAQKAQLGAIYAMWGRGGATSGPSIDEQREQSDRIAEYAEQRGVAL